MLEKEEISIYNKEIELYLAKQLAKAIDNTAKAKIIDNKFLKVEKSIENKVADAYLISQYFERLWNHSDLNPGYKDYSVNASYKLLIYNKQEIVKGKITLGQVKLRKRSNYKPGQYTHDIIKNENYALSPFQEIQLTKVISNLFEKQSEQDYRLVSVPGDIKIMWALNNSRNSSLKNRKFHYLHGIIDVEKEILEKKTIEAKLFISKMKDERILLDAIRKLSFENEKEKEEIVLEFLAKQQLDFDKKRIEELKKVFFDKIAEFQEREKQRGKDREYWNSLKEISKKNIPLYKKIEDKANITKEHEENIRNAKLKEIKNSFKPLNHEEFVLWEIEFKKRMQDANEKRKIKKKSNLSLTPQRELYISDFHNTIAQESELLKKTAEMQGEKAKIYREKMIEFSIETKEKYLPKIRASGSLTASNAEVKQRKPLDPFEMRRKGIDNLQFLRSLPKKRSSTQTKSTDRLQVTPSKDYLEEIRMAGILKKSPENKVANIFKDETLTHSTKKELLRIESEKLEEKVNRIINLRKVSRIQNANGRKTYDIKNLYPTIDNDDDLDDLFVNSIKAKLKLLDADNNIQLF